MTLSIATSKNGFHPSGNLERNQRSELARLIERNMGADGIHPTAISRLFLIRRSQPTDPCPTVYDPALCIVVQGRKQVMLADEIYIYGPEQFLVVSIDLPMMGQVIEATPAEPYLCLKFNLDPAQLSALMVELGQGASWNQRAEQLGLGLSVNPLSPPLLDAVLRLARLLETPND